MSGMDTSQVTVPEDLRRRLSRSVGRLLTLSPDADSWEFSGQCVAIHSHLLFTAAHCCWNTDFSADDRRARLQLRVLFMGEEGHAELLDVDMIRWSGRMDVAILRVQGDSPFVPLPVARSDHLHEASAGVRCALVAFQVTRDNEVLRHNGIQSLAEALSQQSCCLPHLPAILDGPSVSAVDKFSRHPSRPPYLLARSRYLNQQGLSGGAVVGFNAAGETCLLGVHTHQDRYGYEDSLPYISARLRIPESDEGAIQDDISIIKPHRDSDTTNSPPSDFGPNSCEEASPSSAPRPTLKSVSNELRDMKSRVNHESGGEGESVFVVAHSILAVHPRWTLAELERATPPSASAASSASAVCFPSMGSHVPVVTKSAAAAVAADATRHASPQEQLATEHASAPASSPSAPAGTLLTICDVKLSSPFGKFTLHLREADGIFVASNNSMWALPWGSVRTIFKLPDLDKRGQFLVLHCPQSLVQAKGTKGKLTAREAIIFRSHKPLLSSQFIPGASATPHNGAAALHACVDQMSDASSQIDGWFTVLRTLPALASAEVFNGAASPLKCSHGSRAGVLYFLPSGLVFLRDSHFLLVSDIQAAQVVEGVSLVRWIVTSSSGSEHTFANVPRAQSHMFEKYFRDRGVPQTQHGASDAVEAANTTKQTLHLLQQPPAKPQTSLPPSQQPLAATDDLSLTDRIAALHLHASAMHPAASQQRVILFDDLAKLVKPALMNGREFDQQWNTYEKQAGKLATADPNGPAAIAEQRELDSWQQAIAGMIVPQKVVGPFGFYAFVRWFHHHCGAMHASFREAWFETEEHLAAVLCKFDLPLPAVISKDRPYLTRLNLRQHIQPVNNRLLSLDHLSEERIRDQLSARIIGQIFAVQAAAKALLNLVKPLNPLDRPVRLVFSGPASTGKTELAKAIAKELGVLDSPAFVSVLGSELSSESDLSKVIGSAPGLVGAEVPTVFKALKQAVLYRDAVGKHCFIVVFIDEAHKIDRAIQTVLREFMYTGCMTSSTDGKLDVGCNILVVQANNWANESIQRYWHECNCNCPTNSLPHLQSLILEAMRVDGVEGATAGRYGVLVPFTPLNEQEAVAALRLMWAGKTFGWKRVDIPDEMLQWMYRHLHDPDLGLRHLYDSHLLDALNTLLRPPPLLNVEEALQSVVVVEWDEATQTATSVVLPPLQASAVAAQRELQRWQPSVHAISSGAERVSSPAEVCSPTLVGPSAVPTALLPVCDELFRAAARDDLETIQHGHLQSHPMNFVNHLGLTLLDAAVLGGGTRVLDYLLQHELVDSRSCSFQALNNLCSNRALLGSMRDVRLVQMLRRLQARQVASRLAMAQSLLRTGVVWASCEDYADPLFLVLLWCDSAIDDTHRLLRTLLQYGHPLLPHHWPLIKSRRIPSEVFKHAKISTLSRFEVNEIAKFHWRTMDALRAAGCEAVGVEALMNLLYAAFHDATIQRQTSGWTLATGVDQAIQLVVSNLCPALDDGSRSGTGASGDAEDDQAGLAARQCAEPDTQQLADLQIQGAPSTAASAAASVAASFMEIDSVSAAVFPQSSSAAASYVTLQYHECAEPNPNSGSHSKVGAEAAVLFSASSTPRAAASVSHPMPSRASSSVSAATFAPNSSVNHCPCRSLVPTPRCGGIIDLPWDDTLSSHAFLPLERSVLRQVCHHLTPVQFEAWFAALKNSLPSSHARQLDDDSPLDLAYHAQCKWKIKVAELRTVREIKSHLATFLK